MGPGITFNYRGVGVDECARVQLTSGPMRNLYAAGEIISGNILRQGYLAGLGLTMGTVSGRLAGRKPPLMRSADMDRPPFPNTATVTGENSNGGTPTAPARSSATFLDNVVWQLEVCNACRYCEGYCAVFPALEPRSGFTLGDVQYLATCASTAVPASTAACVRRHMNSAFIFRRPLRGSVARHTASTRCPPSRAASAANGGA